MSPSPAAVQPEARPRTVDMVPLEIRAAVQTINEADRTVDVVWTTGAPVERMDWRTGQRYMEVLSLDPAHVMLGRLNDGAPLLDSHSGYSVTHMLGAVVPGSVSLTKKDGRARVRFSRRPEVEGVWQDVRDDLVRFLSVGYRVYQYEETEAKGNALPIRTATRWEPHEVSMVPMPADAGAKVRDSKAETFPCEIVNAQTREEKPVTEQTRSEFIAEQPAIVPAPAPAPAPQPNERDLGAAQERERVQGILTATRAARLPQSFADEMIKDPAMTLVRAQSRVFEELNKRAADGEGPGRIPQDGRAEVIVGDDPLVHERAGIEEALLNRFAPDMKRREGDRLVQAFPLTERGRKYRAMKLMDVAKSYLSARGIRVTNLAPMELAGAALGLDRRGGMHTTSDFADLLADLPNKILRQAYEEAPQTFAPIVRRMTLADFKAARLLQLGEAPALEEVLEHGEFKSGTIGESKESVQLKTYGKKFAITRQALVNDDTDAFARIPLAFGRQARNLESDLVWAQITANAAMGDNVALFHTSSHGNLASVNAAISVDSIGIGRAAMRRQTGIDGSSPLNLAPMFLIVPVTKETLADQFVSVNLVAAAAGSVNPFAGKLQVIAEPRLDANSTTAWYLAASPAQIDTIVLATLDGENGPMVESRVGFDVDGLEIKVRHDVAAKVVDYRGFFKNVGA